MANKVSFNSFPTEIKLEIFSLFNPAIVNKIARVCKHWKELCRDSGLWRRFYCRNFLVINPSFPVADSITPELKNLLQFDLMDFMKDFARKGINRGLFLGMYTVNNFDNFTYCYPENMEIIRKLALLEYKPMSDSLLAIPDYYLYYKLKFLKLSKHASNDQIEAIGRNLVSLEYLVKSYKNLETSPDIRDRFITQSMRNFGTRSFFQNYVVWKSTQNNIKNINTNRNVIPPRADKLYPVDRIIILFLWTIWLGTLIGFSRKFFKL